jgi:NADPH-dependent glutamate synthase beta subunit-like oxidoreductase
MVKLTINSKTVEVPEGTSVWQAAKSAGIDVPTMCYTEEAEHFTSCMVCLVKDAASGRLFASCSTPVFEGQQVITNDQETEESRVAALELLLSEHVGDCEAPCQLVCPAHMNIPLMNRLIAKGDFAKALEVVKRDIAIPAILGRICPAPCEAGCRRKQVDEAVAICHLKRYLADMDLGSASQFLPEQPLPSGRKVAIIGSGPAGLSAAWYLQLKGHQVTIFEKNDLAGGDLLKLGDELLPREVLDQEISVIQSTGVIIKLSHAVDENEFSKIVNEFDAIIVSIGTIKEGMPIFGLEKGAQGITVQKNSYLTSQPKVFAIGNALRNSKMAVRSAGQGKEVATVIDNFLKTAVILPYQERFSSKFGRLSEFEFEHYLKDSETSPRQHAGVEGFSMEAAMTEAKRCMHCDCRNPESCVLRKLSDDFKVSQRRFSTEERKPIEKLIHRQGVVYESNKCIKCGICVRLTRQYKEEFGFTFVGRGFDVKVGVSFNEGIEKGLAKTAAIVAKACPTGALAKFDEEEQI